LAWGGDSLSKGYRAPVADRECSHAPPWGEKPTWSLRRVLEGQFSEFGVVYFWRAQLADLGERRRGWFGAFSKTGPSLVLGRLVPIALLVFVKCVILERCFPLFQTIPTGSEAMSFSIRNLKTIIDEAISKMYASECIFTSHMAEGDSARAEFNLTIHIASGLIQEHFSICAESPFKMASNGEICHLDFVAQRQNEMHDPDTIILFECKRITPQKKGEKLLAIVKDYNRIINWPRFDPDCLPLHFALLDPETRIIGVIAVLITDEPSTIFLQREKPSIVNPVLSTWWLNHSIKPKNYPAKPLFKVEQILDKASVIHASQGTYLRDRNITATAYAIFDLGTLNS
jgi:hypothetical protein